MKLPRCLLLGILLTVPPTVAAEPTWPEPGAVGPTPGLKYHYPLAKVEKPPVLEADVVVYGGTPGGVGAAVQAARMGKKAVLVVYRRHVGGMTSGGLTATDVGNAKGIAGMAKEFYDRVGKLRGFRPSEAEKAYLGLLADAKVPVYFEQRLTSIKKDGDRITQIETECGAVFKGKMFIDASYEGDLLAKAGVSFTVGREANSVYGETHNGVQVRDKHQFVVPVDPYKKEGDPKSGLLWGISADEVAETGSGDKKVQTYCFRWWLTNGKDRRAWPKPAGYDKDRYELLLRYTLKKPPQEWKFDQKGPFQLLQGDSNNAGAFSTDNIGRNYKWPEGNYKTREEIYQDHVLYQQGLMWFMANDERVPKLIRDKVNSFGLPPDEFPETNGFPHELYVREGRRLVSDYVMTEKNCLSKVVAEDSVGLASYNMDSHNCQRVVIKGEVRNEGDVQEKCPKPYPVSYRSIVPREKECVNLFVPVCLSSSHIAYGSIRMEPVFMILGQSAGTAASMAIDEKIPVQKVDYAKLKERLLKDKQALEYK